MFIRTLVAAGALLCVAPAFAEPPPTGYFGPIPGSYVHCWKEADLRELIGETQADVQAGFKMFRAKQAAKLCGIASSLTAEQVGEVEEIGTITYKPGVTNRIWLMHIGNARASTWIMYEEPLPGVGA